MFTTGEIPTKLSWQLLSVLPKPDRGTRGIGLIEHAWKIVEKIIDTRISAKVRFHDSFHGFIKHRGTGTTIGEARLQQEHVHSRGIPLFQVFLDLKKAYDTVDCKRLLKVLEGYRVGPHLLQLAPVLV